METFRVIFKNGGWLDIKADYVHARGDGHVRLWQTPEDRAVRFDKQIAVFAEFDVWGVAIKGHMQDRNIIPDDTRNISEMKITKTVEPIDLSGACWPDSPTKDYDH